MHLQTAPAGDSHSLPTSASVDTGSSIHKAFVGATEHATDSLQKEATALHHLNENSGFQVLFSFCTANWNTSDFSVR